jgi:hypothetical protein
MAAPSVASASSGGDYVVVLDTPTGSTCPAVVQTVADDYGIATTSTYSASLCGFSATLHKWQVRALGDDSRVAYLAADDGFSG